MNTKPDSSITNHDRRDRLGQLCCLFVLGELSSQDRATFEAHLRGCSECRKMTEEYERMMLFDLPATAASRGDGLTAEMLAEEDEGRLLAKVREKAGTGHGRSRRDIHIAAAPWQPCAVPWWRRARRGSRLAIPVGGWALLAVLLVFLWFGSGRKSPVSERTFEVSSTVGPADASAMDEMMSRASSAEKQRVEEARKFSDADARVRRASQALARMTDQIQSLSATNSALQADLAKKDGKLTQTIAELELTRGRLNEETASKDSLQGQLAEVYARFEKQDAEIARLQNVAAKTPMRLPIAERAMDNAEAKEILGARDLHIFDVYDVDNSGKSSRDYGRVYYVNRSLLVFYAFDLSELERNHKAVAFQAWEFRQPQSKAPESLGLFYMDDAKLNRWTLRVSDPQLLSRIDTLFVTVEPPGGSHFPKGRRLLMASLAGPPNHP